MRLTATAFRERIVPLCTLAALIFFVGWGIWSFFRATYVTSVFDAAQIGDSRQIIQRCLGTPEPNEPYQEKQKDGFPGAVTVESYPRFLERYAFYYDAKGKLVGKCHFASE